MIKGGNFCRRLNLTETKDKARVVEKRKRRDVFMLEILTWKYEENIDFRREISKFAGRRDSALRLGGLLLIRLLIRLIDKIVYMSSICYCVCRHYTCSCCVEHLFELCDTYFSWCSRHFIDVNIILQNGF